MITRNMQPISKIHHYTDILAYKVIKGENFFSVSPIWSAWDVCWAEVCAMGDAQIAVGKRLCTFYL